ncbi:unnamed protein product [Adineta steineri]|uniref:N-acetyltransferase domain-containing protein n=1 Tax=Adineta steineri TaxID=433720 RepID=A0A814BLK3_9BILA|nr:unnamed protein product [Adineta steineri]CAF3838265.1 unnamed protein product [Adineta steineri]
MADNYLHKSTDEIKYISMKMFRPNMDSIPSYSLPSGYLFQSYKKDSNDDEKWIDICKAAGEFKTKEQGMEMFEKYFGEYKKNDLISKRLYFLVNPEGKYVGTATAGIDQIYGKEEGSLWWVSIIPEYQGKKLAKPLVSYVLHKIAEYSNVCYLDSQTTSWRAINMYADFNFVPSRLKSDNFEDAWKILSKLCDRNFLNDIDQTD